MRVHAILGGKSPHPQTFLVGGMSIAPEWRGPAKPVEGEHQWNLERQSSPALSADGLAEIGTLITEARQFVHEVYVPDVIAIMGAYGGWSSIGRGIGHYLAFGGYPEDETSRPALFLPRGRVMDRDLDDASSRSASRAPARASITPGTRTASTAPTVDLRVPADGRTEPRYAGPKPPFSSLAGFDRYSWVKSPRYEDDPMEVGPLARLLVATAGGSSAARTAAGIRDGSARTCRPRACSARWAGPSPGAWRRGSSPTGSPAGSSRSRRISRRATWRSPTSRCGTSRGWPREAEGLAMGESPGGAVGHWLAIRDHRIERYQIVDGTTWNASPRDTRGRRGAMEEALVGTPVADPDRPLEVLRTIRSFNPCLTCGVH